MPRSPIFLVGNVKEICFNNNMDNCNDCCSNNSANLVAYGNCRMPYKDINNVELRSIYNDNEPEGSAGRRPVPNIDFAKSPEIREVNCDDCDDTDYDPENASDTNSSEDEISFKRRKIEMRVGEKVIRNSEGEETVDERINNEEGCEQISDDVGTKKRHQIANKYVMLSPCSCKRLKCFEKMTNEERKSIFDEFWNIEKRDDRMAWMYGAIDQTEKSSDTGK